jgi:C-terminal processing protease CtpA/Prc
MSKIRVVLYTPHFDSLATQEGTSMQNSPMLASQRASRLTVALGSLLALLLLIGAAVLLPGPARAQSGAPPQPAPIVDDEGGPVVIRGEVDYTDPFFTLGVASPMVILEDQAGFVDRNERFIMPPESQTIGQITSDFFDPPFSYSLALPIVPQGTLRDVDNDGEEDTGVMTFAVAYWTNTWGDPFLEERDLYGGGWSTAYASTRVSEDWDTRREIIGGKFLVYAPDDQQGFPSGFGEDGLLFTEDDPIVILPQGYTIVDLDTDPFTFSRPAEASIDLIEPDGAALDDFSDLSYPEAFDALVDKMRKEYAFTEYKGIDWDALSAEFRPRFEEAEADGDMLAYVTALREFAWRIPDGHVSGPPPGMEFQEAIGGGLGLGIRDVDDGRVIVNFLTPGGPAEEAGIELGAEIIALDGVPIDEAVDAAVAWSAPFSTEHVERLQKLRYAVRFPLGTEVEVTWANPGGDEQTETIETSDEAMSFNASSFRGASSMLDLPVQYEFIPGTDYVRVSITSFADNSLLAIQLWERMITTLNQQQIPGLVIDMRNNLGGAGFLADQMAAYFFQEPLELGQTARYDESLDEFKIDERNTDVYYLPDESLRFDGPVAVLIGPNCNSACEFFAYDMTLQDRAAIIGQYATAGLGGGVTDALMPLGIFFRMTVARALDMDGEIHIEGKGVQPTVQVPVTEETLFSDGDPILEAAVEWLDEQ